MAGKPWVLPRLLPWPVWKLLTSWSVVSRYPPQVAPLLFGEGMSAGLPGTH